MKESMKHAPNDERREREKIYTKNDGKYKKTVKIQVKYIKNKVGEVQYEPSSEQELTRKTEEKGKLKREERLKDVKKKKGKMESEVKGVE